MNRHGSLVCILIGCMIVPAARARTVLDLSGAGWTADGVPVSVPHSWNIEDGTDGKGFQPWERMALNSTCASGYERKAVVYARQLPAKKAGKRYFIRFDGASIFTTVRVNGKQVGTHNGAFTGFAFEITDALTDAGNRLEAVVDNHVQRDAPPVNADFTMYGGLYRGVRLIETDPVCIDPVTDGASGVQIDADADTGRVKVKVSVLGTERAQVACHVTGPGFDRVFEGDEFTVPDCRLWSPESPALYSAEVTVRAGDASDTVTERFGFRKAEFRSDGFYLNGKRRFVRGVNHNQDRLGKGWALSADDHREDLEMIRALGADGVRTTVYPHAQLVYDLCDELGLLAWIETPNVNGLRFTDAFRSNAWNQAREMVAQYRNHPSIFVWGIFNELYNKVPMTEGEPEAMMEELRDYVHGLDASRPVAAVSCEPTKKRLNAVSDVLGFNRYPGWYVGTPGEMRGMIDEVVRESGREGFVMTEYGAGAGAFTHGPLRGKVVPRSAYHPVEYQAFVHCEDYRCLKADPRVWGTFVWCMFDFGSDCRLEGEHFGLNDKGIVAFDHRTKKDAYWFYRANWTSDPVLHLVGSTADTASSPTPDILVFCNTGRVTLEVNGREIGALEPDEVKSCRWDGIVLDEGANAITVRSGERSRTVFWWNPKTPRREFTVSGTEPGSVQTAVDRAGEAGGGRVHVPRGDYPIAFLQLRDNVTLELAEGARLFAETNALISRAEFARREHNQNQALVVTKKARNVAIVGKGVIDGIGYVSKPYRNDRPGRWKLVTFQDSDGIRLEGVTLTNSCSWTCYFQRCRNVTVRGVTVDGHANYNNDGFDIEAQNVLIENCSIDCEDDCICGKIHDPDFVCENVEVRDCRLASNCNFIKLGTASLGLFRNWFVHGMRTGHARAAPMDDLRWIDRGIIPGVTNELSGMTAIALEAVDGGQIENVRIQDVEIGPAVHTPIFLRVGARKGEGGKPWYFRNVTLENIRGRSCSRIASSITGVPSRRLGGGVLLKDIDLVLRGGMHGCDWRKSVPECEKNYPEANAFGTVMPAYGFYLRHADGIRFENVRLRTDGPEERPAIAREDVTGIEFKGCDFQ